jgi:hypothetical protein
MNRDADNLADVQWVAQCARRLREQWPRVELALLEEAALELWRDDRLRGLPGEQAAAAWLAPLVSVKRPIEWGLGRAPSIDRRVGLVASALSGSSPVTLADRCSARHKQSEDFGGQRVVGIAADRSTLELMAHTDLHRLRGRSYACHRPSNASAAPLTEAFLSVLSVPGG